MVCRLLGIWAISWGGTASGFIDGRQCKNNQDQFVGLRRDGKLESLFLVAFRRIARKLISSGIDDQAVW